MPFSRLKTVPIVLEILDPVHSLNRGTCARTLLKTPPTQAACCVWCEQWLSLRWRTCIDRLLENSLAKSLAFGDGREIALACEKFSMQLFGGGERKHDLADRTL
jgi:hypothetical protein